MKVYLAVSNFEKLYVNYTILKEDGAKETNSIVSDTNIIELPFFENATYTLEYWCENKYQKTQKYYWQFVTTAQIQEPPNNITVTPTAANTAAYVNWENVAKEYTVHVIRRIDNAYTYETYATEHNFFIYTAKQPIEYVQFAISCGIGDNKPISPFTTEVKLSSIPTQNSTQLSNIPSPSFTYTTTYIHTNTSIRLDVDVTHANSDLVLGTFILLTDNSGKQWLATAYKDSSSTSKIVFDIPWVYSNSQTFTLKVYPITTTGVIESKVYSQNITLNKFNTTPPTPNISSLIAGGFDTLYVAWNAVSHPAPVTYELQYDTNSSFTAPTTVRTNSSGYTLQFNFSANTTVHVRVRAVDTWGNASNYSSTQSRLITSYSAWQTNLNNQLNNTNTQLSAITTAARSVAFVVNSNFENINGNPSLEGWQIIWATPTVVTVSDGIAGKYAVENPKTAASVIISPLIPIDTQKAYIAECYARQKPDDDGTNGRFYFIVSLYDENRNRITGDGSYWYYPAAYVVPPKTWTYYYGIFGYGTSRPFPSNARYMAVGAMLNYQDTAQNRVMQLQAPRIRLLMDSMYIKDAAITDAKIANVSANKITTGTLDAARIAAGSITADKLNVNSLSAISANAGTITAGVLKSSDDNVSFDLNNKLLTIKDNNGNVILKAGRQAIIQNGIPFDGIQIGSLAKLNATDGLISNLTANKINLQNLTLQNNQLSSTSEVNIVASNSTYKFRNNDIVTPDAVLDGNAIKTNSMHLNRLKQFSMTAGTFSPPTSFTPSVSNVSITENNSYATYSTCEYEYYYGYYITKKHFVSQSFTPTPSVTTSYNSSTGAITITPSFSAPSGAITLSESTTTDLAIKSSNTNYPSCAGISTIDVTTTGLLPAGTTMNREGHTISCTLQFTLSGFSASTTYRITPQNCQVFHNGSWTSSTITVSGITSLNVRITDVNTSPIRLTILQSGSRTYSFNIAPIPGARFLSTDTSINIASFHTTYNPWNSQGYTDTGGTSGTSGWRWIPNMPLDIAYFTAGQASVIAWAWDLAEAFGQGVKLNIAVQGVDDSFYIFSFSNSTWTQVVGIPSFDANFNIRTYAVNSSERLIAVLRDTGGDGFAYFTISIVL